MPSLTTEVLEHFDDPRFDAAYETKLQLSGDDLLPILGSSVIVEALLSDGYVAQTPVSRPVAANGNSAAAVVPAFDIAKFKDEIVPREPDVELPVLGTDPSEAEMMAFASAHPTVRAAMRVFRAKIVEVKKA